jgi:hypothetical protein
MIMRKADADTEAGVMPSKEIVTAMTSYNEESPGTWATTIR